MGSSRKAKGGIVTGAGAVVLAAMLGAGSAQAALFTYEISNPPGGTGAGDISDFAVSYDDITNLYSLDVTVAGSPDHLADGFWQASSPGPNPKGTLDELAIIFADSNTGDAWVYEYNGANGPSSIQDPGNLIAYYPDVVTETTAGNTRTISMAPIDITPVQNFSTGPDWTGLAFDEGIGVWFHPVALADTGLTGDASGITAYPVAKQSFYDVSNKVASSGPSDVPEPGTLMLLLAGLIGVGFVAQRRRTNTAA